MTLQHLSAQCTATYTVGSNTAYPLLSTAPAGVSALTSGQSVKIDGTFTVDAGTWNLSINDIYFATTASEIIVNASKTLNASTSNFQSCPGVA